MPDQPIITRADLEAIHKSLLAAEDAEQDLAKMFGEQANDKKLRYHAARAEAYNHAAWLVRMYLEGKVATQEANRNA